MTIGIPELGLTSAALPLASLQGDPSKASVVSGKYSVKNGIPELWFPHTQGKPKRYNITITLDPIDITFSTTTGFRTVVLNQAPFTADEVDKYNLIPGDRFNFEVNGQEINTKGTSLVPFGLFHPAITTEQVRWIVQSVVRSGQNMVKNLVCSSSSQKQS